MSDTINYEEMRLWVRLSAKESSVMQEAVPRLVAEVERLRADLAYEKQLHKDANIEVERLRAIVASHKSVGASIASGVNADLQADRAFAAELLRKAQAEVERLREEREQIRTALRVGTHWQSTYADRMNTLSKIESILFKSIDKDNQHQSPTNEANKGQQT